MTRVLLVAVSGGICWWRHNRGADCDDATTLFVYGEGRQFPACQHHREMVADLLARHTDTILESA